MLAARLNLDNRAQIRALKSITHVGALIPLLVMTWDYFNGGLGPDIIRELTLRTGKSALILLILSLAVTPLITLIGWKQLQPLRKLLGLYAFLYVAVHLLIFVWLDYLLDLDLILDAIFEKRYALAGFAAFLILLPLAITSTTWAQRKLGKRWRALHRWDYLAGLLAILHYVWLVKEAYSKPAFYGGLLLLLLLLRLKPIKLKIGQWQRQWRRARLAG